MVINHLPTGMILQVPSRSLAAKAPEQWRLEDDPFLLGFGNYGNFLGASC